MTTAVDLLTRKREWKRNYVRQLAYGTWNPWVDATEARNHVTILRTAGIGRDRIAELAGIPRSTLALLIYGRPSLGTPPSTKIRPETAARILAIRPSRNLFAEDSRVDATGTRRRLQALAAAGWPGVLLAERAGWNNTYVSELQRRTGTVYARTAQTATGLYNSLVGLDPVANGASPTSAHRAQLNAQRLGWLPSRVWDADIDDPATDPNVADTGTVDDEAVLRVVAGGSAGLTRAERIEAARIFHAEQGLSLAETAARLGLNDRTILRWKQAGWPVAA